MPYESVELPRTLYSFQGSQSQQIDFRRRMHVCNRHITTRLSPEIAVVLACFDLLRRSKNIKYWSATSECNAQVHGRRLQLWGNSAPRRTFPWMVENHHRGV